MLALAVPVVLLGMLGSSVGNTGIVVLVFVIWACLHEDKMDYPVNNVVIAFLNSAFLTMLFTATHCLIKTINEGIDYFSWATFLVSLAYFCLWCSVLVVKKNKRTEKKRRSLYKCKLGAFIAIGIASMAMAVKLLNM